MIIEKSWHTSSCVPSLTLLAEFSCFLALILPLRLYMYIFHFCVIAFVYHFRYLWFLFLGALKLKASECIWQPCFIWIHLAAHNTPPDHRSQLQKGPFPLWFPPDAFSVSFLAPFALWRQDMLAAAQCIVISPGCLWVCGCICLLVCYHGNSNLRASILTKLGL